MIQKRSWKKRQCLYSTGVYDVLLDHWSKTNEYMLIELVDADQTLWHHEQLNQWQYYNIGHPNSLSRLEVITLRN